MPTVSVWSRIQNRVLVKAKARLARAEARLTKVVKSDKAHYKLGVYAVLQNLACYSPGFPPNCVRVHRSQTREEYKKIVARHEVNGVVKTFIVKANRPVLGLREEEPGDQKKALLGGPSYS